MTTKELTYPVIVFDKQDYILVNVDEDLLTTTNSATLRYGGYTGNIIVDSQGRAFKIRDTRFISGKGRFWGFTFTLDRIIRVELVLDDKPLFLPLDKIKQKVLRDMKRGLRSIADPHAWLDEMRKVKEASNVQEIIDVVLPYYDTRGIWNKPF